MRKKISLHNLIASAGDIRLSRLLMAAAALHLFLVSALNVIGRYAVLPHTIDKNGIGISFAVDSTEYRRYIIALLNLLERDGLLAWIKGAAPFHVKLYSLCYAALGPWLGYTTLSAEPLNLAFYLLILVFVFLLGREVFDRRVGLLSAGAVAIWPSLLLHTTQLLRDPIFIIGLLAFLLVCVIFLNRECSWGKGLALACAGGLAAHLIWLIRSQMWEVIIAIPVLTLCLILLQSAWKRRIVISNLVACCLLLLVISSLPQLGRRLNLYSYPPNQVVLGGQDGQGREVVYGRTLPPGTSLPARISYLRRSFVMTYPRAGSNIDQDVTFNSVPGIILYLPRAAEIGFFAPFPNMWFVPGTEVGLAGRLLSGFETLLVYALEILSVISLWYCRRHLSAWLLVLAAVGGMIALGLVVANLATLYRLRYAFWILLIIPGIKGALIKLDRNKELIKTT